MRCEESLPLIEAYFDGELDGQLMGAIKLHVDSCDRCATALQELYDENQVYRSYERPVEVTPQMWAGVRDRIGRPALVQSVAPKTRREWPGNFILVPRISAWATAALILIAIGITIVVMRYVVGPGKDTTIAVAPSLQPQSPAATPAVPESKSTPEERVRESVETQDQPGNKALTAQAKRPRRIATDRQPTPNQLVREAELKYLAAIGMLSRSVENRRNRLDSETRARFDIALSSIDRTIAGTRKAVREHPEDPEAVQYMLSAYARKVDVLRQMVDY